MTELDDRWGGPGEVDDAGEPVDAPTVTAPVADVVTDGVTGHATDHVTDDEAPPTVLDAVEEPIPVDDPTPIRRTFATITSREEERRPIIPAYLRSKGDAGSLIRWAAIHYGHKGAFHFVRLPMYSGASALYTLPGVWKLARRTHGWVFDAEGKPLRQHAIATHDRQGYLQLQKDRDRHVRQRAPLAFLGWLGGLVAAVLLVLLASPWLAALLTAAGVGVLGRVGAPADRPVVRPALVRDGAPPRLTSDVVARALGSIGIAELRKATQEGGEGLAYVAPIQRDGPGWLAQLDLPHGVTVTDVMERRESLSAGLRRPLGCVWPEANADVHEGRLHLWVGDQDMRRAKQAPWPLLKRGQADVFSTMPLGSDYRGRPVGIDLVFANLLVGAIPRQGKTFTVRVVALYLALDPRTELRVFELKGTGDLDSLAKVAHHYGSSPSEETLDACMASLREVYADLLVRAERISALPKSLVPENKVTPEVATRQHGLHIKAVIIDEVQELFTHEEHKGEATRLCEGIIKRGPAMGVFLLLATQRPDAKSLPTSISANMSMRLSHKVMGQLENDMILGTSMYKNGVRATTLTVKDKGIGVLVGAHEHPATVRVSYVDGPAAEEVSLRARALREAAGTITGHAAGERPEETIRRDLLDDVGTLFVTSERLHSEGIVAELAERWPDVYGSLTVRALAAQLPRELKPGQVWVELPDGTKANRQGLKRDAVFSALEARTASRALGS